MQLTAGEMFVPLLLLLLFFNSHALICSRSPLQSIMTSPEQPQSGDVGGGGAPIDPEHAHCESWRLAVETNNAGKWRNVPLLCACYVAKYVLGSQFSEDSKTVARLARRYAKKAAVFGDGRDVWIFDIDDTLISNSKLYIGENTDISSSADGKEAFDPRVGLERRTRPEALPWSYWLYNRLHDEYKFEIIILSGRKETDRNKTVQTLLDAGYKPNWKELILREVDDLHKSAKVFKAEKRRQLIDEGYRIHGSYGDQWSDLLGSPRAKRSFKVPNPMYHIS